MEELLSKCKTQLLMKKGVMFFNNVILQLNHVISKDIPTAATDGISVLYNPDFFISLSQEERLGLMMHEGMHVALLHMVRRGKYDPMIWNQAGDYVINLLLINNGFKLPPNALVDTKFQGMSTDQVYEYLLNNSEKVDESFVQDITLTEELTTKIVNNVLKASQEAELSNNKVPKEVKRRINELINPILSWNDILYRHLDSQIKYNQSWKRPNKRYLPDIYLPSNYSNSISNLTIAIDTSGSISDELLTSILSEINYINKTIKPESLTILDCDYKIHNIYLIDEYTDILTLKFSGKGSTNFDPVISYCNNNNTNILVYFTDLYAKPLLIKPEFLIYWICYSNHLPAIVGETIYVNL